MGRMTDFANPATYMVEGVLVFFILWKILSARRGRELFIRRIPGLTVLDEAVGRATEMGRPMLYVPGLSGLDIVGLQSMSIMSRVIKRAANYSTRVIVPLCDAVLYTVAEEVAKDAYATAGVPEQFIPEDIRYLTGMQFAYASGVVGIQHREKPATAFYFGSFFAEALILAENGQMIGAIQVAGTPSVIQIPFFLAACDYVIIGDEYYAASAYLSREPTLLGSLVGQDYGKLLIVAIALAGVIGVNIAALAIDHSSLHGLADFIKHHFLDYFPRKA
jgi:hypothetical protein